MQFVLEQLIYFGFFQSLLLLTILLVSIKKRQKVNEFLLVLLIMLTVGLLGKFLYSAGIFNKNFRLNAMSEFSALLFGPTIYLFRVPKNSQNHVYIYIYIHTQNQDFGGSEK